MAERMEMPEHMVRGTMKIATEPDSMATSVGEDGNTSLGDMIDRLGDDVSRRHGARSQGIRRSFGIDMPTDCTLEERPDPGLYRRACDAVTGAATLHAHHITNIQTSAQASSPDQLPTRWRERSNGKIAWNSSHGSPDDFTESSSLQP
ncbi:sigma-70 domain-containing protein [Paraburkholderia sp. BL10I2N1]|uniref:sigma-70 domain-containing protein n=1 Tax=Paraburkholderia sp. BL10I2N1 TaxID=1938796 RepID=UPI003261CFDE